MEEPIRKEDIIDVAGTLADLDKLIFKFGEVIVVMKRFEKEGAGAVIKAMNEANTATKEGQVIIAQGVDQAAAIDAQKKERAKIEKEYLQLIARRNELEGEGAKINAQLRVENQKRTQALNAEAKASNAAEGSVNRMRAELKKLTDQYNNLDNAAAKKAAPAIRKLSDELKKAESIIGNNTRNVGNYKSAWTGAGKTILAAVGIIGGATMALRAVFNVMKNGFQTSFQFEAAMAKVKGISGATKEEFEKLRESAITLSTSTTFTAKGIAELQIEYAKLGFSAFEISKVTKATLDLSMATGEDLANSANIAGATLRQYQLDASQMQRVVDIMAESFNKSALDLNKFATAMQHAGPVAKAVNETLEDTTAKLSVLANSGLDASIAGTSLRNIYMELEKRGLTWDQAMNKIAGSQNKASASLELFGKRGAVAGIVLADNQEVIKEFTEQYKNASGAAKEMAGIMINNVAASAKILKSTWEGLILRTNESNGAIKSFIDTLSNLVSAINTKGKPAIDSMFDVRQIETFTDKWKFYASQGIGFWATLTNSILRSKDKTQEYSDELSSVMGIAKKKQDEIDTAKLEANAKDKKLKDDELRRLQELIDNEENGTNEIVGIRLERSNKIMEIDNTSLGSFRLVQVRSLETIKNIGKLIDESEEGRLARQKVRAEAEIELNRATAESKMNIASGVADFLNAIAGKNKAIQYAALIADKALAIAEVIIQTQKANAALRAWGALGGPAGIILATAGIVKNNIASVIGIAAIGAAAAMGIAGISKSAKMAKGGSGILEGPSHQRGGINVGIGEAEGGEHIAITSRKMTNHYGSKMLDAVSNSINQGKFFEVWANVNKEMSLDPYTKKMYEMMRNTPTVYPDTDGSTVKEYPDGRKYIIKHFHKN